MRPAPPRPPHQHPQPHRPAPPRVPRDFHVHSVTRQGIRRPVAVFSARLAMPCTAALKHAKALRADGHTAWISCAPAPAAAAPSPGRV